MKSVGKITLGIILAFVLLFGGCMAIIAVSMGGSDDSTTVTDSNDSGSSGDGSDDSSSAGELSAGGFTVVGGRIKPEQDPLGDFTAAFRVENTNDSSQLAWFTVNLLKGKQIVGSLDCTGPEVAAGRVARVTCISSDQFSQEWNDLELIHEGF